MKKSLCLTLLLLLFLSTHSHTNQMKEANAEHNISIISCDILLAWNERVIKMALAEDGLLTLKGLRTLAMMHIAIHNALNIIEPQYDTFASDIKALQNSDPIAAVASAAFEIAVSQFPAKEDTLTNDFNYWLSTVRSGKTKSNGIQLGIECAAKILSIRNTDQWNTQAEYTWHPMAPGVYAEFNAHSNTPEGFIFGAGWAKAKPFVLPSADFFRAIPPPPINSEDYTKAFKEVKAYGKYNSTSRSADQSHLAMWWKDFAENSHNRLARHLVSKEQPDLWQGARLFALLNMSIYDAYINVFDNKFHYNHWRPYTAIRWAKHDGNPQTIADTSWNNLHRHTYAFPSYPSAHGCASAAAMTILADVFGDDYAFTMTTTEVDSAGPFSGKIKMEPPTRSFKDFHSAAMECGLSRVYLGIHFRYDSEQGVKLGTEISRYILNHVLKRN